MSVSVLTTPCVLTNAAKLTADLNNHCLATDAATLSVDFTNVHIVALRSIDEDFTRETSGVDWFVSDSQVLSWSIRLLGGENHSRVYGPDFLGHFIRHGAPSLRHFFLGASQECLDALCEKLREIQPDLQIAGSRNGYFDPSAEPSIVAEINAAHADILWVGLGTPKQQQWIHRHQDALNCKAILAVGFAFDVNAGTKPDAPRWLGPLGLTWLYRLAKEPRRLWKRYLVYNSVFLCKFAQQVIKKKVGIKN